MNKWTKRLTFQISMNKLPSIIMQVISSWINKFVGSHQFVEERVCLLLSHILLVGALPCGIRNSSLSDSDLLLLSPCAYSGFINTWYEESTSAGNLSWSPSGTSAVLEGPAPASRADLDYAAEVASSWRDEPPHVRQGVGILAQSRQRDKGVAIKKCTPSVYVNRV
jgi:hypothetical protein